MALFSTNSGILFVDVGFKSLDSQGSETSFVESDNSASRLQKFLKSPLPDVYRDEILAAGANGITGEVDDLNIVNTKATFIVFQTTHANWAFDPECPIDLSSTLNAEPSCSLIQITGRDDTIILYNDCENASHRKYSLFINVTDGSCSTKNVTKIIIDPRVKNNTNNTP